MANIFHEDVRDHKIIIYEQKRTRDAHEKQPEESWPLGWGELIWRWHLSAHTSTYGGDADADEDGVAVDTSNSGRR